MIEFYNDYIISYHYYQNHPSLLPSSFHFELHFSKKKRKEKKKKGIHIMWQCGNIYVYNLISNFSCLIIKINYQASKIGYKITYIKQQL